MKGRSEEREEGGGVIFLIYYGVNFIDSAILLMKE